MISFDVFCQLNKHLAEIEFLEKGYASTKEQPVSLEMLCRSNAIRILAKKNSSLASLCANATDNESVIASLIMQCNAKPANKKSSMRDVKIYGYGKTREKYNKKAVRKGRPKGRRSTVIPPRQGQAASPCLRPP